MFLLKMFATIAKPAKKLIEKIETKYRDVLQNLYIQKLINDVPETNKAYYSSILKNSQQSYNQSLLMGGGSTSPSFETMMAIIKRILDNVLQLKDIIGIQPMSGPVGMVYRLQYRSHNENKELMSLDVISTIVESGSTKLRAQWSLEAAEDLKNIHSVDIESEIIKAIAEEISYEIITNILQNISNVATTNESPTTFTSVRELVDKLRIHLDVTSTKIAQQTRRGSGNFITTSPMGIAFLQTTFGDEYIEVPTKTHNFSSFQHCGNIVIDKHIRFKVFSTLALNDIGDPEDNTTTFVVGYKGPSDVDTGYVYCPYVPLVLCGKTMDPVTHQPVQRFMTRDGRSILINDDKKCNYFHKLQVSLNLQSDNK